MIGSKKLTMMIAVIASVVMLSGCSQQNTALNKMEADNMALVRHVHAEVAKGNIDVFDEALAGNYVRHCQAMPPEDQEIQGGEKLKTFVAEFLNGVSDFSETIDVMFADSDKVAYVTTMWATHTGDMNGIPATNKQFKCVNVIVHRFEEGKIAESWVSWDNLAMLTQLGLFPPPSGK